MNEFDEVIFDEDDFLDEPVEQEESVQEPTGVQDNEPEDLTHEVLRLKGIADPEKIKFEDETEEQWKQAICELDLDKVDNLFLVVNSKDNAVLKKMNINTIPRYMLYDSHGTIVNLNAPRPSSENIERELGKYLSAK